MSFHGSLSGKGWQYLPSSVDWRALSPSPTPTPSETPSEPSEQGFPSTSTSPCPSRLHSPSPTHSDTALDDDSEGVSMKLGTKDMSIYGQCPVQDDLVLVVCEICGRCVKLEAFYRHQRLRHSGKKVAPAKLRISVRSNAVLVPVASSAQMPSLIPHSLVSKAARAPCSSSSRTDDMSLLTSVEEEMDSSTSPANNVISIPDTDPLPPMSTDLMAMVAGQAIPSQSLLNKRDQASSFDVEGVLAQSGSSVKLQVNSQPQIISVLPRSLTKTPGNASNALYGQGQLSAPATPSTPSSSNSSKKASPAKKSGASTVREFHPDKHCGVWDNENKRQCTRALTCKSHSVLLKRKVAGRSKKFDELVAEYKANRETQGNAPSSIAILAPPPPPPPQLSSPIVINQEALNAQIASAISSITEPTPLSPRFSPYPSPITSIGIAPVQCNGITVAGRRSILAFPVNAAVGDNLVHYTTDHPKPLAVCTFGGRRLGGLLVADRSQFLTRKVVRIAISAGGFHRIRPASRLNENINVIGKGGRFGPTASAASAPAPAPAAFHAAEPFKRGLVNLSSLPPGAAVKVASPDIFRTDIQDFKGGIKFELGKNVPKIKQILPAGADVRK